MKNSLKNKIVTVVFCLCIAVLAVLAVSRFASPVQMSESERRPLAQPPKGVSIEKITDKTAINEFEDFSVDQFPFREFFRTLKANFQINVLRLKENNGIAVKKGYFAKIEPEFTDGLTDYSIGRLSYIYDKYLKDTKGKKFICLVPDKNYFFGRDYNYPMPDYDGLKSKMTSSLPGMTYIDIFDTLTLEDYYRTDTHWSQDKIGAAADKIAAELGIADKLSGQYNENKLEGFKGVYYGQSALQPTPDTLVYLTNDVLDSCTVFDYETNKTGKIYDIEKFEGTDGYDVFLSGTRAMLRIDNPMADTDKELVVFRDSFGSSMIPLLAEGYKSIYIIDIRYVMPDLLGNMMDFEGKDVLYLYSALILNQKAFK